MASSAPKRVKERASCSQSQSYQESITSTVPDLPAEVIQHILEMGGNLKLVKNCRLVSKSWNQISCTVLKKLAVVSIEEDDEKRLEQFKDFLLGRQLGVSPELPNPFQYYTIGMGPDFPASISKFIQYPNVRINVLNVTLHRTISAIQFKTLLGSCKPFLRRLSIANCCEDSNILVHPELTTGWSSLKQLAFDDESNFNVPKNFIKFIQALIQGNPSLQQLSLAAGLDNVKKCLVSTSDQKAMVSLRSLSVSVRMGSLSRNPAHSTACIKDISALEAPNLKKIKYQVSNCYQTREDFQEAALTLVRRNSQNLTSLSTNLLDLHQIPIMSQLERLSCIFSPSDRFEFVNAKNFPCLTALKVSLCLMDILEFRNTQDTKPHVLLKFLDVQYPTGFEFLGPAAIWQILGRHFPNVTEISVSFRSRQYGDYTENVLRDIGRWFPQLESLEFSSNIPITLFEIEDLETFYEKGWALQDVTHDPILGLKNLVDLKLKNGVTLAQDFLRFGLPQMKNLRSVCFPWDEIFLAPNDISEYLGFLTNIHDIVITTRSLQTFKELWKLAEETSNVSIKFT